MKYYIVICAFIFLGCKQEKLQRIQLPEGICSISIPKEMREFKPKNSFEDGLKFRLHFIVPDSSMLIDIEMRFHPDKNLTSRLNMEEEMIKSLNGDCVIIKSEVLRSPKESLLITYSIPQMANKANRYLVSRMLFNTTKNLCILNLYANYSNDGQMLRRKELFKKIVSSIEIPNN
ncbi:hypothetical protein [Chitinophaga sp. S165]|uniref:hypothetical protein n=1 Tax=Chitinophaga sp. S165 TaxID=2135462 RepID=UPI000D7129E8|nr:hypothetical protein [Chitinophaga sp. S165]PWV56392.1 hypothetical protein C7475_101907 [Chitinophaga sp. S165]